MLTKIIADLAMMPNANRILIFFFLGVTGIIILIYGLFSGSPTSIIIGMILFALAIGGLSEFM